MKIVGAIAKRDDDRFLIFGWASVSVTADGETVVDSEGDTIPIEELEKGAYSFVLSWREGAEMHSRPHVARMVESVVFTPEKIASMGLKEGTIPQGWWVGFKVHDAETWQKVKNGEYSMFSIGGTASREAIANESA